MTEVAVAYVTLLPSARGFRSNTERALRPHVTGAGASLGGVFGKSFGRTASAGLTSNTTGIRSALKSFSLDATSSFTTITAAASTLVGVLGGIGIRTAASLQQAQIGFATLLGSASKASAFLTDVRNFAVVTPFDVNGLIANSRALLGVGVSAKGVIPTLRSLGNVTAAFGLNQEQFNGILRAFTQIASKGKVQAEELLQMSEAGLPAMQLFAKGLHVSVTELLKMTQASKLTAAKALPALLKQLNKDYGGSMARQFHTLSGVFNNFKESAKLALSDGMQPLLPILQTALPAATTRAQSAIKAASGALSDFIAGVRGKAGLDPSVFARLGAGAATAFSAIKSAISGFRSQIEANRGTLTTIADTITTRLVPALAGIAGTLGQGVQLAVGTFFSLLTTIGVPAVGKLASAAERVAPALQGIVSFLAANKDFIAPFAAAVAAYTVTVKAVARATRAWAAAQTAVNAAMLLNPYVAAAAAVIALASGMVYLNETTGRAHNAFISLGRVATAITVAISNSLVFVIRKSLEQVSGLLRVLEAVSNPLGKITHFKSPFGRAADQLDKAAAATHGWKRAIDSLPSRIEIPASINVSYTLSGASTPPFTGSQANGSSLLDAIAGRPSDAAIASRLRGQASAISKATKKVVKSAGKFNLDNLLAKSIAGGSSTTDGASKAAKAAKAAVKKAVDAAKSALQSARQDLAAYAKGIRDSINSFGDATNITSATGAAATPSSVQRFLNKQLAIIKRFQANLHKLVRKGISSTLLRQIADAGPEAGGPLAEALVRADKSQFGAITSAAAQINKRATASGDFVAGQLLGPKVATAQTKVDTINVNIANPKPERASTSAPKAVRRALLAAG